LSLQKYKALVTAVELGSISRAAEQLGYTQSAVSRMIADLEKDWGMDVLNRGKNGVQLTSSGQQLLQVLRAIVADCDQLENTVRELHGMQTGTIRLGTFTTAADRWLPDLLKGFASAYPNITFTLHNSESYEEIAEWIRHGQVDCGFVRLPAANDLTTHFLKEDMLVAVLPVDHPMAKDQVYPVEQLSGESIIKLQEDQEISDFLEHLPEAPNIRYVVSSDHTILSMVESSLGISIMHSLIADTDRYRVVWKQLDHPQYRQIAIATSKNARLSIAVQTFVDYICKVSTER